MNYIDINERLTLRNNLNNRRFIKGCNLGIYRIANLIAIKGGARNECESNEGKNQ